MNRDVADMYRSMGVPVPDMKTTARSGADTYLGTLPCSFFCFQSQVCLVDRLRQYTYEADPVINEQIRRFNWPCFDGIEAAVRQMRFQMYYDSDDNPTPEHQFMKLILTRKRQQLAKVDFNGLDKCDVLCKIPLPTVDDNGQPRVWRIFKVSAGTTLSALQDKAIAPIMGWVRNFHSYIFTDYGDGAIFGPEGSNSVDQIHLAHVGYKYLPDNKYKFAHLFEKEGDHIGYIYDFGDKWYHDIEIFKIYSPEESTGAIKLIVGRGMCPGENLKGNHFYNELLMEFEGVDYSGKAAIKREILSSPNYNFFGKPSALFDPSAFDLSAARARIADALSGPNSVPTGTKKFHIPFAADSEQKMMNLESAHLKKGQSIVKSCEYDADDVGFWNETISNKKDSRKEAVCGYCGKPGSPQVELKSCAGCQQILYCSREHQRAHWKSLHKKQCSQKYPKPKK